MGNISEFLPWVFIGAVAVGLVWYIFTGGNGKNDGNNNGNGNQGSSNQAPPTPPAE